MYAWQLVRIPFRAMALTSTFLQFLPARGIHLSYSCFPCRYWKCKCPKISIAIMHRDVSSLKDPLAIVYLIEKGIERTSSVRRTLHRTIEICNQALFSEPPLPVFLLDLLHRYSFILYVLRKLRSCLCGLPDGYHWTLKQLRISWAWKSVNLGSRTR
jgi:hypothetical protein